MPSPIMLPPTPDLHPIRQELLRGASLPFHSIRSAAHSAILIGFLNNFHFTNLLSGFQNCLIEQFLKWIWAGLAASIPYLGMPLLELAAWAWVGVGHEFPKAF